MIRDIKTLPSTILPNGETAETVAHMYVLTGNKKRNKQKRKRELKNVDKRPDSSGYHQKKAQRLEFVHPPNYEDPSKTKRTCKQQ